MKNVYSTFKRGDVWFVKLLTENGDGNDKSSVQKKSRPYVIVSCEQNNLCAPIINAIPISTQMSDHLPPHVYFRYMNMNQIVMCEHITTLSVTDFNRQGSHFMYTFSAEFMNQIDEALSAQLGLRPRVADMRVLENIIERLAVEKETELKNKYEKDLTIRVEALADMLAKKFGIELSAADLVNGTPYRDEELALVPKELKTSIQETIKQRTTQQPVEDVGGSSEPEQTNTDNTTVVTDERKAHRSQNKWTTKSMEQFLEDYKKLTVTEMAEKYNMKKISVPVMVSTMKRKLGLVNTNDTE